MPVKKTKLHLNEKNQNRSCIILFKGGIAGRRQKWSWMNNMQKA